MNFVEVDAKQSWRNAMDEEIKTIKKNNTWEHCSKYRFFSAIYCRYIEKTAKTSRVWCIGLNNR
jgi:hypothetical protein